MDWNYPCRSAWRLFVDRQGGRADRTVSRQPPDVRLSRQTAEDFPIPTTQLSLGQRRTERMMPRLAGAAEPRGLQPVVCQAKREEQATPANHTARANGQGHRLFGQLFQARSNSVYIMAEVSVAFRACCRWSSARVIVRPGLIDQAARVAWGDCADARRDRALSR